MPARLPSAFLSLLVLTAPVGGTAQLAPPSSGGVVELDRLLQQLSEPRRVLLVAAHPDDEDTSLLALLARGFGAHAAYLALTRGDGGQNLIGPELGTSLGLLRSRELVSARAVDGASQFFTRAYDFGYTRSLDETLRAWPRDSLLKDVVRIVRRFKPHVMVSVFSGTPRDGHGQHQAAGAMAHEAFEVAGDGSRFPELHAEEGLDPWSPTKLYRSMRFRPDGATDVLETGGLDPLTGRSYHQIAMESRSQHRSQDMGTLQAIGPRRTRLQLVTDRGAAGANGSSVADRGVLEGLGVEFSSLNRLAARLRSRIDPLDLGAITDSLVRAGTPDERSARLLARAVATSSGIVVDAVGTDDAVVPGQSFEATVVVYNGGRRSVAIRDVRIEGRGEWAVTRHGEVGGTLDPGGVDTIPFHITVSPEAEPTTPYFLRRTLNGSMYDWTGVEPSVRGLPFQPPPLQASVDVEVLGATARVTREVTYRFRDQALGEVRREIRIVPRVDVKLSPTIVVWPVDGSDEREFVVTLTHHGETPFGGEVRLEIDGWPAPTPQRFAFAAVGESRDVAFNVRRPAAVREGSVQVRAVVVGDDGRMMNRGLEMVAYPHIRPTPWARLAASEIHLGSIALPPVTRVGYLRGAADRVPEALGQIGLPIEVLTASQLATADLARYDVIVVGSRAYETDTALTRHNSRLLAYARNGGTLIVQYQQYAFVSGDYAAYPLDINRPHDRVTNERAPMRILDPAHAAFRTPNRITDADWLGWPQERGLYFAGTWAPEYEPLLETNDPGGPPLQGGLLVADYGSGTYVYTGLSFFRALPAGNPGAFRLFVNLLGLKPQHAR